MGTPTLRSPGFRPTPERRCSGGPLGRLRTGRRTTRMVAAQRFLDPGLRRGDGGYARGRGRQVPSFRRRPEPRGGVGLRLRVGSHAVPWRHSNKMLHLVCELREPRIRERRGSWLIGLVLGKDTLRQGAARFRRSGEDGNPGTLLVVPAKAGIQGWARLRLRVGSHAVPWRGDGGYVRGRGITLG